ncbi:High-affinity K+ transport system, ATPase chain B [Rubellimicrobium mesophilum DSM 19309]|uniref:High-affinity K+ transport system, ATPase chain B n=1 Tax=Rubellimicrobium mesophilum DSM 19309 TaxID=442562 RepID=A0A017HT75_9RHOB|nr:DUF2125 domain-containing protein [Rubellimicrobium mesophilum]EYD77556.1 High-affinity K+ transport system, ATPase chain B [Rubellimicrobium mesophilum DSM 19309]
MRTLLLVIAALFALLSGGWFLVAWQIESRAEAALADLRARGFSVDYADLSTTGFPSRFDTTATNLRLATPDGRVIWEAPFLRVTALSIRPNRVTTLWPQDQTLTLAGQRIDLSAKDLRASATVGLSTDLPLDEATIGSGLATVQAENGLGFGMDRLAARAARSGSAYDLFAEVEGLRPATVSANIGLLRLDARVTLDAPLELRSPTAPRFRGVALREVRLAQGDVALTGSGTLEPDAQGYLAGTVNLTAENWPGLLDLLQAAGLLAEQQRPFVEGALAQMAQGSDRIEVPVTFADGKVEALGLVLLEAPRVL